MARLPGHSLIAGARLVPRSDARIWQRYRLTTIDIAARSRTRLSARVSSAAKFQINDTCVRYF